MARPTKYKNKHRLDILIEDSARAKVEDLAKQKGVSISDFITELILKL